MPRPSARSTNRATAGSASRATPLLGGLAIFAGVLVAAPRLPARRLRRKRIELWHGVLIAAALITFVGALDDRFDLPPLVKLAGQIAAAVIVVHYGVAVKALTLPFAGTLHFPKAGPTNAGPDLTVVGLVVMMNIVNLSDGVDGLAAGVCVIIAGTSRSSPSTWTAPNLGSWPRSPPAPRSASWSTTSRPPRPSWAIAAPTCSGC